MDAEPATWTVEKPIDSLSEGPTAPLIVTSSPSRIHTVPSEMTMSQCQRLHGSRSSLAGMLVVMTSSTLGIGGLLITTSITSYPTASAPCLLSYIFCVQSYDGRRPRQVPPAGA